SAITRCRAACTGLGIVSPVGNHIPQAWSNIIAGKSGVGPVPRFDASSFPPRSAGEVRDFDITAYLPAKTARGFDTFIHFGLAASAQAIADSGIEVTEANAERIGAIVGSGIGGLPLIEETHTEYLNRGVRRLPPFFVPGSVINMT